MGYRSIVVHINNSPLAEERIRIAARIALIEKAHLIGVASTGLMLLHPEADVGNTDVYYAQTGGDEPVA